MTPELERAVEPYRQWFGSYKKSGELAEHLTFQGAAELLWALFIEPLQR